MYPILVFFLLIDPSTATQIFSETVGKVIVTQNTCSVMPHRVWKRFHQNGPKPLGEYPPETIKFLMTWVHSAHGVESRLENMLLKWDEQSICFDRPSTMTLKKIEDGGSFSSDMNTFTYLEVPEYWVVPKEDDEVENWKNVKLEECSTTDEITYHCPTTAINDSCSQKELEKCSERIEMNSSDVFFTLARRLGQSYLLATRARRGTIIRNGNIFDIKPIELPERIFKITLAPSDMMSIGAELLKN